MRVTPAQKQALLAQAQAQNLTLAGLILRHCLPGPSQGIGQQLGVFTAVAAQPLTVSFPDQVTKRSFTIPGQAETAQVEP